MSEQMYGRTTRSMTMHKIDSDGRPKCRNKRIGDQMLVSQMTLAQVRKYLFLTICTPCSTK